MYSMGNRARVDAIAIICHIAICTYLYLQRILNNDENRQKIPIETIAFSVLIIGLMSSLCKWARCLFKAMSTDKAIITNYISTAHDRMNSFEWQREI